MTASSAGDRLDVERAPEVVRVLASRTGAVVAALEGLDAGALARPSLLPGWDRLTIVCHLRYGAAALRRMTDDVLAGRPASYYPDGRHRQRPGTLQPAAGESPADVVASLAEESAALDERWRSRVTADWARTLVEPPDNPDLGAVTLGRLAMARLLEVEVHGADLDIGLPDWSTTLVEVALPTRLAGLATRRTNHRAVDDAVEGAWVLRPTDARSWLVAIDGGVVTTHVIDAEPPPPGAGVIEGSSRDLLALLLGRAPREPLRFAGDTALAERFPQAFPGP